MLCDEVFDACDELRNGGKSATADALAGQFAKESLDHIQPRTTGRDEVHVKATMPLEPRLDLRVLVGRVVVNDEVKVKTLRCLPINLSQKFDPFLMTMTRHAAGDHAPFGHLDGREQCRRPIALVVVGHRSTTTAFEW